MTQPNPESGRSQAPSKEAIELNQATSRIQMLTRDSEDVELTSEQLDEFWRLKERIGQIIVESVTAIIDKSELPWDLGVGPELPQKRNVQLTARSPRRGDTPILVRKSLDEVITAVGIDRAGEIRKALGLE